MVPDQERLVDVDPEGTDQEHLVEHPEDVDLKIHPDLEQDRLGDERQDRYPYR